MRVSARNQLTGTIIAIQPGAVNGVVKVELPCGQVITSTISMEAMRELDLRVGQQAFAVIKTSDVMIGVDE